MASRTVIYPTRSFRPLVVREVVARSADDGRTQDWYRQECDILHVVEKFHRAQDPSILNQRRTQPIYGDMPSDMDFHSAMIKVSKAETAFSSLPSKVREKYGNSTQDFLRALSDPAEAEFLAAQGIIEMPSLSPQPKNFEPPTGAPEGNAEA